MVISSLLEQCLAAAILAQQQARPLQQLDPPKRAAVLMAILGLVLTGLMLVAGVMIGAHWVRRLARQKPYSHSTGGDSASRLASQRLRASLAEELPDIETSATVQIDRSSNETKIERKTDSNGNTPN
jgi:hypothetical protein